MKLQTQKKDESIKNRLKLTLKTEKKTLVEICRKKTEKWKMFLNDEYKLQKKNYAIKNQILELSLKLEELKVAAKSPSVLRKERL